MYILYIILISVMFYTEVFCFFSWQLRKKAMELKEKGVLPEEQKTIGDMIDEENDFDKENEFFPEKGDNDDASM